MRLPTRPVIAALLATRTLGAGPVRAQDPLLPHGRALWVGVGAALVLSLAADEPIQRLVAAHQRHDLEQLASDVDPLGRANYLVPLRPQGEWGSMPSAHVTHAFVIAAGIAEASGRPWVASVAYGFATLVAADRVYRQRHWASDAVVGATVGIAVAHDEWNLIRHR